jgi:hypothetical protein
MPGVHNNGRRWGRWRNLERGKRIGKRRFGIREYNRDFRRDGGHNLCYRKLYSHPAGYHKPGWRYNGRCWIMHRDHIHTERCRGRHLGQRYNYGSYCRGSYRLGISNRYRHYNHHLYAGQRLHRDYGGNGKLCAIAGNRHTARMYGGHHGLK